ncbi:MAG: hypothetical protein M1838_002346 [Thelocarpon superellum]|nr:MAG: hypothetical protein M1838_002346 [Thelocarpon superellum]
MAGWSWLYPLKGITYFATHPFLWPLLKARLIPCLLLSIVILAILFLFTYLPQVAFLALFHGRLAWFNAAFLVLGEGSVIIALLFEAWFVDETQADVFDAVFIKEGLLDLVSPTRQIDEHASDPVKMLGRPTSSVQYMPFSIRLTWECIVYLPLNLIPLVGTPAYLILTGRAMGPFHHWRYFKLLGYHRKERNESIRRWRLRYTWFGTVALTLQLIPLFSMLFLLTSAAGAALWAADLHREQRDPPEPPAPAGEPYTDDPV